MPAWRERAVPSSFPYLPPGVSRVSTFEPSVRATEMNYRGPSPGSLLSFNINDGYADGILRGFKLGLLGPADYANLSQCDVIDGTSSIEFSV